MDFFIDEARIQVEAGKGGNGCVSFRREKYVEFGGPNGGDGGDGGSVYIKGSKNAQTLAKFKDKYHFKAKKGTHGQGKARYGKKGEDITLTVPIGTVVYDELTGSVILDIIDEKPVCIAIGGKGGRGNSHFKSSTNRAPEIAEDGKEGQVKKLKLELKVLADVGLIGLPNAGKSTLITQVSNSHSQVAPYAFSTLRPYLGVVKISDWQHFIMADIPGIIKDAHKGVGIGLRFLKHIERSKIHLFMIDLFSENPAESFLMLKNELIAYNENLMDRPYLIALNKVDGFLEDQWEEMKKDFLEKTKEPEDKVFLISAVKEIGLEPLMESIFDLIENESYHDPIQKEIRSLEEDSEWVIQQEKQAFKKAQKEEEEIEFFWETSPGKIAKETDKFHRKK